MEKIKTLLTKENILKGLKWFFFSFIWLAILMFIVDIVSKTIVKSTMIEGTAGQITLIPNFLFITYIHNNGMAFGIDFQNQIANTVVFISVSVIGAIAMIIVTKKFWKKLNGVGKASLMLMISGTIGNLIDRAFYVEPDGDHFVVDFIHFRFFGWDFPCFNVADSCLVIGTIMLIIFIIVKDSQNEKAKKAEQELKMQGQNENQDNANLTQTVESLENQEPNCENKDSLTDEKDKNGN